MALWICGHHVGVSKGFRKWVFGCVVMVWMCIKASGNGFLDMWIWCGCAIMLQKMAFFIWCGCVIRLQRMAFLICGCGVDVS